MNTNLIEQTDVSTTPRVRSFRPADAAIVAAVDAQPRFLPGHVFTQHVEPTMRGWREMTGAQERGAECADRTAQDGRIAGFGAAYVTTIKQLSTRSGPPPCRPQA